MRSCARRRSCYVRGPWCESYRSSRCSAARPSRPPIPPTPPAAPARSTRAAAGKPLHVRAVSLLDEMYESYTLEYVHVRRESAGAPLTFEPYPTSPHAFGHHTSTEAPAPLPEAEAARPPLAIRPAPAS